MCPLSLAAMLNCKISKVVYYRLRKGTSPKIEVMDLNGTPDLAREQAHLFGWGAETGSWREEWGEKVTFPRFTHTFPRFAGSRYPNK